MIISDLNYLQTAEENVQGGYFFGASSSTYVNANIKEVLDIYKTYTSKTDIKGNFAGAEASGLAFGTNSATQAISSTVTEQGKMSASNATSTSGSQGATVCWFCW